MWKKKEMQKRYPNPCNVICTLSYAYEMIKTKQQQQKIEIERRCDLQNNWPIITLIICSLYNIYSLFRLLTSSIFRNGKEYDRETHKAANEKSRKKNDDRNSAYIDDQQGSIVWSLKK